MMFIWTSAFSLPGRGGGFMFKLYVPSKQQQLTPLFVDGYGRKNKHVQGVHLIKMKKNNTEEKYMKEKNRTSTLIAGQYISVPRVHHFRA